METLAIIAYQQPITRTEIEEIRGVKSDRPVQTLMTRALIEEAGRKEGAGRPILFATTKDFLTYFGLTSLDELPPLPEDINEQEIEQEADLFLRTFMSKLTNNWIYYPPILTLCKDFCFVSELSNFSHMFCSRRINCKDNTSAGGRVMRGYAVLMIVCFLVSILVYPSVGQAKPGVSANNAVLMEQSSGRVLYNKQAHEQRPIASITKIMTAIVAIESGKMNETVTVSDRAIHAIGSSIYLEKGEKIKLKDLVYGLMLRSGNDAAVAISEHVGGSVEGFVHLMNKKAKWLGMTNTSFANPHGLDADNHYSTAYDMALLMCYAMDNEVFRQVTETKIYKAEDGDYVWRNKHKLLTSLYQHTIGGKTGYTSTAGRTLVTVAEKDGMELIAVTLNAPDDWRDHTGLFEWGFKNYDMTTIAEEGQNRYRLEGSSDQVIGYLHNDIKIPLRENQQPQLDKKTFIREDSQRSDVIGKTVFSQIMFQLRRHLYMLNADRPHRFSLISFPFTSRLSG